MDFKDFKLLMIKEKYFELLDEIKKCCEVYNRDFKDIKIVIASKYLSIEQIQILVDLGHKCFGENKIQQSLEKIKYFPDLEWNFIGHLQSNKARIACDNFQLIQSVDSLKLLYKLQHIAEDLQKQTSVLLQINITEKQTQTGFSIDCLERAYVESFSLSNLKVKGLMVIGESNLEKDGEIFFIKSKSLFDKLKKNYGDLNFSELSMGMSSDFRTAIKNGSTMIRIGRYLI